MGYMVLNKSLSGQDMWKDFFFSHLEVPKAVLTVVFVLAHKTLTPPSN